MFCQLLLSIKLMALTLTEKSFATKGGTGMEDAPGGTRTLDPEAVTSRSRGLRGRYHSLLLLFLTNMRPVHVSLDLQGIGCVYDLL